MILYSEKQIEIRKQIVEQRKNYMTNIFLFAITAIIVIQGIQISNLQYEIQKNISYEIPVTQAEKILTYAATIAFFYLAYLTIRNIRDSTKIAEMINSNKDKTDTFGNKV